MTKNIKYDDQKSDGSYNWKIKIKRKIMYVTSQTSKG